MSEKKLKHFIRLSDYIRDKIVDWEADKTNNVLRQEIEDYFANKPIAYNFDDGTIYHH